jgi:hypothetical protein
MALKLSLKPDGNRPARAEAISEVFFKLNNPLTKNCIFLQLTSG